MEPPAVSSSGTGTLELLKAENSKLRERLSSCEEEIQVMRQQLALSQQQVALLHQQVGLLHRRAQAAERHEDEPSQLAQRFDEHYVHPAVHPSTPTGQTALARTSFVATAEARTTDPSLQVFCNEQVMTKIDAFLGDILWFPADTAHLYARWSRKRKISREIAVADSILYWQSVGPYLTEGCAWGPAKVVVCKLQSSSSTWRASQFPVEDTSCFFFAVRVCGDWSLRDNFRIGVAAPDLPLEEGETGHGFGFWLSPKSGRTLGRGRDAVLLPELDRGANGFRTARGATRGKGFGKGKHFSAQALRGKGEGLPPGSVSLDAKLSTGTIWALTLESSRLSFFVAESENCPFEFVGAIGVDRAGRALYPSLLCLVRPCQEECEVMDFHEGHGKGGRWAKGHVGTASFRKRGCPSDKFPGLEVLAATSKPATIDWTFDCLSQAVSGRSLTSIPWASPISPVYRPLRSSRNLLLHKLRHFERCAQWVEIPLKASTSSHFRIALEIQGSWSAHDRFRFGVAPAWQAPHSADGLPQVVVFSGRTRPNHEKSGFMIDPLAGRFIRPDRPADYQRYLPGLRAQCEPAQRSRFGTFVRSAVGLQPSGRFHRLFKQGKGDWRSRVEFRQDTQNRPRSGVKLPNDHSLAAGSKWGLEYRDGSLAFFCAAGNRPFGTDPFVTPFVLVGGMAAQAQPDFLGLESPEVLPYCESGYRPILWILRRECQRCQPTDKTACLAFVRGDFPDWTPTDLFASREAAGA